MSAASGGPDMTPFDALMDAAVDAIVIIDRSGLIQRFNRAAEKLFGYREADVRGRNVSLLMPEPHRSRHDGYLERYARTGEAAVIGRGREELGLHRDGATFPMLLSVGEIKQSGLQGYVGIIRDLTEVRRAQEQVRSLEEQLLHADRLVILGELTAGIAHEINQPLTAIAAYADAGRAMLDRVVDTPGATPSEDMHSICERIGGQARRAAEVVQRLRGLVRSGRMSKARHDINDIIRNILLLFEFEVKKTGTELVFLPLEPAESMYVDEIQVQQILVNLVKNGLDAIAESGRSGGRVEIRVSRAEMEVLIAVSDNGPGVPECHRAQLFDAFFTTKPKGVGLGLSICRTIAAAHGGTLRYAQAELGGSCFTLSLPLSFIG
ncbi:MAG: PAS domain S-box protein [Xanthomonadales bacterium]|jgi:two-component system sensor kinase FixL|nr:PAS domain S-box protein [Xanthomonadales bacterium]